AILAASPYLAAAYLAQGAFKEPMLGLGLLGFALALPAVRPAWSGGRRAGAGGAVIPLGGIAAGTIYNYSFPRLAWFPVAALGWMLLIAWRERRPTAAFLASPRV